MGTPGVAVLTRRSLELWHEVPWLFIGFLPGLTYGIGLAICFGWLTLYHVRLGLLGRALQETWVQQRCL